MATAAAVVAAAADRTGYSVVAAVEMVKAMAC